MKSILHLLALTLAYSLLVHHSQAAEQTPKRPNILFILTDDQGYGDWSINNHPFLKTPHVDRLARESVRLENFQVSPACSPTRAALLTGMHEFRNGVTHTQQPREQLWLGVTTPPQLLAKAGYRNGWIGKWHLSNVKGFNPEERGFDWCSTNTGGPREHFNTIMVRNGLRAEERGYREDIYFNDAMQFIEDSKDQPWFLCLWTYSPHDPLDAPEEFVAPFRGKVTDEQAKYLGMVANLDFNIGRLMAYLKEKEIDEDTIVILMSDNGQTWGLDVYNAGMRGCKATIWEGGSRTFSYWRWTGHWTPHVVDNLTAHLDFLPTICQLAVAEIPHKLSNELEGFSLLPLLDSTGPVDWHNDRMLFQHVGRWPSGTAADHKYAMAGVRLGHYLLLRSRPCDSAECNSDSHGYQCVTLRNVEKGAKNAQYTNGNAQFHWAVTPPGQWALYDLKKDPRCETDLAQTLSEKSSAMSAAYDAWWGDMFPVMIERGGDRNLVWSKHLIKQMEAQKATSKPAKE